MAREAVTALQFFEALYQGVGAGHIEIRPIKEGSADPPRPKFFRWPAEVGQAAALCESLNQKEHVYFGVGLRRMSSKPKGEKDFKLGGKENVGCVTAVFVDLDFKDVPEDELRKMLSTFKVRPSIVVHSGHGIHVYWLLDYPAMGDQREALQEVNLGLLRIFRAQRGVQDYTRILRVPGTVNIKAKYPDPKPVTTVTYFHPESRYSLEHLRIEVERAGGFKTEKGKVETSLSQPEGEGSSGKSPEVQPRGSVPGSPPPPVSPPASAAAHPSGGRGPRPIPAIALPEQAIESMGILFGQIWLEGQRHSMALRVAGLLAFANVNEATARGVVAKASSVVGGDTEKRLLDVRDTYARFVAGGEVVGGPDLERLIREEFPLGSRDHSLKVLGEIRGLLPQPEGKRKKAVEPDFAVLEILKFDSRPPLYTVILAKNGAERPLKLERCDHKTYHYFHMFRASLNEETDEFIANIDQGQWERLREAARIDGRLKLEVPPEEATVTGALRGTLETFLENKKESPGGGELNVFPGYDTEGVFFTLKAYAAQLKDTSLKASTQVVTEFLRREGWKDVRKRVVKGDKASRIWWRPLNGEADQKSNHQGNGHPKSTPSQGHLFDVGGGA